MLKKKREIEFRDLGNDPLSEAELDRLIGRRDYLQFLNPRNELYRERKMSQKLPSRKEAIRLMARNPNLIRRPIVVEGGRMVVGYDEQALSALD